MYFFRRYKYLITTLLVLSITILFLFYQALKPPEILPVYNPADISKELVDSTMWHIKKYHTVSDFSLTNQDNKEITLSSIKGKIHVANFFFTTCPGICPLLTKNMKILQDTFIDNDDVVLLSFSVTPEIDSVSVLKDYALKNDILSNKWHLLTGQKKEIYRLARKSYMAVKTKGDGGKNDMIHTQNFILVDKNRNIRGIYDGTDIKQVNKLIYDTRVLKSENN